jgi:hypothetical protein
VLKQLGPLKALLGIVSSLKPGFSQDICADTRMPKVQHTPPLRYASSGSWTGEFVSTQSRLLHLMSAAAKRLKVFNFVMLRDAMHVLDQFAQNYTCRLCNACDR